jgi:mRNA-degrading endonuclease RelE of RelBE toxin-antitoxin system
MIWKIEYSPNALRDLGKLTRADGSRVVSKIREASAAPLAFSKPLVGNLKGLHSLRAGKIRILMKLEPESNVMQIENISFRDRVYD